MSAKNKKLYAVFLLITIIVFLSFIYTSTHQRTKEAIIFNPLRIAHAGGAINNKTYTNSYEALNSNLQKGFLYFELDFLFTKDHRLICLHDWKNIFKQTFGFEIDEKITLKEFEQLVEDRSEYNNCTLSGLAVWLKNNPNAYIITDVKESNISALKIICKTLPSAKRRVIPQIYDPNNFSRIKELGFEQIIWTLYRFQGTNDEVLDWIEKFIGPVAITMPKSRAKSSLPRELEKRNIPTYVHTVNTIQEMDEFINRYGITEIYTDVLAP